MNAHVDAITLKQLRSFVAVARYQNLAQAADDLFVSRAAVSQTIQELESRLAKPLFDRVRKRLVINDNGVRLLPLALEVIDRMQSLNDLFIQKQARLSHLRLGASQTVGSYLLPGMMARWEVDDDDALPKITIEDTHVLVDLIENHRIDMALVEGEVERASITKAPCHGDRMCIIAAASNTFPMRVSYEQLASFAWIVREKDSGSRRFFDSHLAASMPAPHIKLVLNSNEAVLNAVSSGMGLGFLSNLSIKDAIQSGRVQMIHTEHTFERKFHLIWHKQRFCSQSHWRLMRLLGAEVDNNNLRDCNLTAEASHAGLR